MWRVLVSKADTVAGQVTLGFVNTCVNYPTLAFGFLAIMLMLVCALWVEVLNVRLSVSLPRAKRDEWQRDLSQKVKQAVTARLVTDGVTGTNTREVVEAGRLRRGRGHQDPSHLFISVHSARETTQMRSSPRKPLYGSSRCQTLVRSKMSQKAVRPSILEPE